MNELDKRVYYALKFFADNTRAKVTTVIEDDKKSYDDNVPEDVSGYLSEMNYINAEGSSRYIITPAGIKELRELEQIKYRDKIAIMSVAAIIISAVSLAKSFGWI